MKRENHTEIEIGKKIRALRKIRGISLQKLSKEVGMSYSYLSNLENGKHSVSISNLQRMARFFGVDMIYFIQSDRPAPKVFRREDLFGDDDNYYEDIIYRVITSEDNPHLQASYIYMPPNKPDENNIHKHGIGQEMVISLSGCVWVMVGESVYQLKEGACILFDADSEHMIYTEEEPASFIIVSSPPYSQNMTEEQTE